jgi:hypothetical protein
MQKTVQTTQQKIRTRRMCKFDKDMQFFMQIWSQHRPEKGLNLNILYYTYKYQTIVNNTAAIMVGLSGSEPF